MESFKDSIRTFLVVMLTLTVLSIIVYVLLGYVEKTKSDECLRNSYKLIITDSRGNYYRADSVIDRKDGCKEFTDENGRVIVLCGTFKIESNGKK